MVPFQGVRLTYRAARRGRRRGGRGPARRSGWTRASASASGARTTRSGCCSSTPRPRSARSSSTSTRRTARTRWPTRSSRAGAACWWRPPSSRRSSYVDMVDRGAAGAARTRDASSGSARRTGTTCWPRGDGVSDDGAGRARGRRSAFDDPINIQYTSGTTGFPEGRDAQPPQHPQQRLLRRRGLRLHRGRPGLHPGALLPLLRHGARQPGLHHARRRDGGPGARLRPGRHAADRRRTSGARASTACRRCSSPSSSHPDFAALRPVVAAHRDHGRLAVPGRGDEAVHQRDAHGRGDHLLRHDRDVAGVDPDARSTTRSTSGSARSGGCTPTSRSRSSTRPPGTSCRAGRGRRAVHPRLLRDARLLERPGAHRRGDRRRAVDAHR